MNAVKKNLIGVFACALLVACLLSLAACNSGKSSGSSLASSTGSSGAATGNTSSGEISSAVSAAGGRTETGKYATVKDFVDSDLMQSQLKTMKEQLGGGNGLEVNVAGEENKMVFTFLYELGDRDVKTVSAELETAMVSMEKSFELTAASLKEAVEAENPVVVVTCVAEDGTELYSKEFSAKE